jgi:hypothetical protein
MPSSPSIITKAALAREIGVSKFKRLHRLLAA